MNKEFNLPIENVNFAPIGAKHGEQFKKMFGGESYYIGNQGTVVSVINGSPKVLIGNKNAKVEEAYHKVFIKGENGINRSEYVHRLVAIHFCKKEKAEDTVVNHLNGQKKDNRFVNLEWTTQKENLQHARRKGLNFKRMTVFSVCDYYGIHVTYAYGYDMLMMEIEAGDLIPANYVPYFDNFDLVTPRGFRIKKLGSVKEVFPKMSQQMQHFNNFKEYYNL